MIECVEEYEKMFLIEEKLWWYRILHENVLEVLLNNNISKSAKILDAACGTGGLQLFLIKNGFTNIQGFDLSENAVAFSKSRGLNTTKADLKNYWDTHEISSFEVVICNDAMIYLKEDFQSTLNKIAQNLQKNALFISNNNALGVFKGIHDLAVGDGKRFTKRELKEAYQIANLKIESQYYFPFLLSPLILIIRTFQRIQLAFNLVDKNNLESDVKLPSPFVNELLYKISKVDRVFGRFAFFGSSIFSVLRK